MSWAIKQNFIICLAFPSLRTTLVSKAVPSQSLVAPHGVSAGQHGAGATLHALSPACLGLGAAPSMLPAPWDRGQRLALVGHAGKGTFLRNHHRGCL